MFRRLHFTAGAIGALLAALTVFPVVGATEPQNLYLLKKEIRTYVDSGEYEKEIARIAGEAGAWLEQRVHSAAGSGDKNQPRLAAVFDIDETLLSNLPHMRKMDFGYIPAAWNEWVDDGTAPAIVPVRDLLLKARQRGVAVFILSGRRESDRAGTEKNLRSAGITDYEALRFKPDDPRASTEAFKTAQRKQIAASGYTIVLNIGDQDSDLAGGFAERTFKLPDPFYITK